jgi:CRISPR-associated protein Cmr3
MDTTSLSRSSGKLTYSSPKNPCPVCGRTKDSDCRWDSLCHCRTYAKHHLNRGEVIRGSDGQQWAYLGDSDGGRWALFKPHEGRRDNWIPKLTSSAKQTPKPAIAPSTAKNPRPKGQQDFIYHDADGYPVIKVQRKDDGLGHKEIRQFRWENGQWVAGLNEQVTQRVRLYRINDARALARETGHPIFLVEGESCAERLLKLGIPATTSIGGAGKWSKYGYPNYLADLQDCRLILCPDADFAGVNHMLEVEKSLRLAGIEIAGWLLAPPDASWDSLPDSGGLDVVDWLENGATAKQILDSIRVSLPAHLVVEGEEADLEAEVSELAQLDRESGITLLPENLDTPLRGLAGALNLPVEAYYLPLLCVAASCIPSLTRLEIDPRFQFLAPSILWGGLVGETGSGKSHIINTLTQPLKDIQAELYQNYQNRLAAYQTALREYDRRKKNEDAGEPPEKPKTISLYAANYTLEAVAQILGQQPDRGLLITPDELAVFLGSMDAYRKRGADRAHWLSLYNGDALKVDRKTSDQIFVRYTSVSIIGGIQPSILQKIWQEDRDFGDGLWSRFAWVRVPLVPRSRAQTGPIHNPRKLLENVYRRLQALPPQQHVLDDEGHRLWEEWESEIDELILTEPNEQIRATLPKTKERAARIALVLHCLDAACAGTIPSKVVPASTLARAIHFTRWLQNQTKLLYGELGESSSPEASLVIRFVKRFQGAGPIDLRRCRAWWPARRKPAMSEIRKFVEGVVQMGQARWLDHKTVEVIQPYSSRTCSHVVTQKPESLAQTDSEQMTATTSPHSLLTSPAVAPVDGDKPAQPEPSPSHPRKEAPRQASLPLDAGGRGFKPKGFGSPQAESSADGIPPWQWER